eukprot:SAG11_NODE_34_length_22265_cov_11.264730_14_plen_257_part_00
MEDGAHPIPFSYSLLSITYFIIVIVIQSAVIQGIVIDEFATRRDAGEEMKALNQGYDQVSGVSRVAFENLGMNFDKLMKLVRGQQLKGALCGVPVNYMYLAIYLREKPAEEYTGLEAYIASNIAVSCADFLPLVRDEEEQAEYLCRVAEMDSSTDDTEAAHDAGAGGASAFATAGEGNSKPVVMAPAGGISNHALNAKINHIASVVRSISGVVDAMCGSKHPPSLSLGAQFLVLLCCCFCLRAEGPLAHLVVSGCF